MKLKGVYSDLVSYNVGDVVVWTDGTVYHKQHDSDAGVPPTDTHCWGRVSPLISDIVSLVMDGISMAEAGALAGKVANNLTTSSSGKVLDARQGKKLKDEIDSLYPDSKTIRLQSSNSKKKFDITVNDNGEISATERGE